MSPPLLEYALRFSDDGSVLVEGQEGCFHREDRYEVGSRLFDAFFSSAVAPALADLVDVAMAVYIADRVCPRRRGAAGGPGHRWHRVLRLTVPVRHPERWHAPAAGALLQEILCGLTDDTWDLEFVPRRAPSRTIQGSLRAPDAEQPCVVALFSGGLDSLAGLCSEALEYVDTRFVLVSGWTNGRLRARQRALVQGFVEGAGRSVFPISIPFGLRRGSSTYDDDEQTQRSRGFVHCLFGAAAALAFDADSLACYENGIGAINLPFSRVQLGVENARSAHPIVLQDLSDLVEFITGRSFSIRLPFLMKTKGQVCGAIRALGLEHLVAETVSCDFYPRRVEGQPQCGACTSCVLRRQALKIAGLHENDPSEGYAVDLHQPVERDGDLEWCVQVMLGQVHHLRAALAKPLPWAALIREYPMLHQTVLALGARGWSVPELRSGIVALYREYCAEWERFQQQPLPIVA